MNYIKKILEFIKKYYLLVISLIIIILFMLFLSQCNQKRELKNQLKNAELISKQNYASLNDTIKLYKNKMGNNAFSKPIAEMSTEEIKKYYPELYKQIIAEKNVQIIWKTKIEYRDTGSVKNSILKIDSNKYVLKYDYYNKDSTLHIKSTNNFYATPIVINNDLNKYSILFKEGLSTIEDMSLKINLTTGIKKEGDLYKIFVTSDNNNINVTKIEGADVTNLLMSKTILNKKKWSVGPNIGVGLCFSKDGKIHTGIQIGFSLQYALIKF